MTDHQQADDRKLQDQPRLERGGAGKQQSPGNDREKRRRRRNQREHQPHQMSVVTVEHRLVVMRACGDHCRHVQQRAAPGQQRREVKQLEQVHSRPPFDSVATAHVTPSWAQKQNGGLWQRWSRQASGRVVGRQPDSCCKNFNRSSKERLERTKSRIPCPAAKS
ncbi:hypothetical protein ebA161 [Aromatoleum aromaticum EbN1]|uniref:Uncharacterized protein n=1 Tax=Aromatoleum aromaticum (strain DSM 19018 / LMG 30748 / EbN1) TaxID=76114 RepID=Q5P8Z8_AROAE|nr:hypothetical protein ebA161 [Aromatoleum aromaticum EbN1]